MGLLFLDRTNWQVFAEVAAIFGWRCEAGPRKGHPAHIWTDPAMRLLTQQPPHSGGGKWMSSKKTEDVVDPLNGEVFMKAGGRNCRFHIQERRVLCSIFHFSIPSHFG